MKAYKIEILVIDFDRIGIHEIIGELENVSYPNDCINVEVMDSKMADIGKWHDEDPLNHKETTQQEYIRLFS